jgi:hypothetical protein
MAPLVLFARAFTDYRTLHSALLSGGGSTAIVEIFSFMRNASSLTPDDEKWERCALIY